VTTASGDRVSAAGDSLARDWAEVRADASIQFEPVQLPEDPQPPSWLLRLFEFLGDLLAPVGRAVVYAWPVLQWILLAAGLALLLYLIWRLVEPSIGRKRRRREQPGEEWVPDSTAALALLEEADRLAAAGRFDEATHMLLQRSVGQIAEARPDLVEPSSTAREIAAQPALSDGARHAFGTIAERVERSLFALRRLEADDWQAAREAYADFARVRLANG
jgi:hypothetical protein